MSEEFGDKGLAPNAPNVSKLDEANATPAATPSKPVWDLSMSQLKFSQFSAPLGSGEFGEVKTAILTRKGFSEEVAVKCANNVNTKIVSKFKAAQDAIANEWQILCKLSGHPNIVSAIGLVTDVPLPIIVMEYLRAGDLIQLQKRKVLTDYSMRTLLVDLARAIEFMHIIGYVHRDVSGKNCLISNYGNEFHLKLTDFGLSRFVGETNFYQGDKSAERRIPAAWTAPEALNTWRWIKPSDIWSFGVVIYEIYTKKPPYAGLTIETSPSEEWLLKFLVQDGDRLEMDETTPADITDLAKRCWNLTPEQRPTATDIIASLTAFLRTASNAVDPKITKKEDDSKSEDSGEYENS